MARTRLLSSPDAPQLTQSARPRTRSTAPLRKRVQTPATTPDAVRDRVYAFLAENPQYAPRNAEEKAASASMHEVFRAAPAKSAKTVPGGRPAPRGRPSVTPGTTPGTPATKSGGGFPAAVNF